MRHRFLLILPITFLFSCGQEKKPELGNTEAKPRPVKNCMCSDTSLTVDSLCPDIPHDVLLLFTKPFDYHSDLTVAHQPSFDLFSWQSFVALNWPADANGNPIHTSFKSDFTSLRVWENFVLADTVFKSVSGGPQVKLMLKPGDTRAKKQLYQVSKFSDNINIHNSFFEADSSTLIDKNLNYVLFEERMNDDEWNYIDSNNLRTEAGQLSYVTTKTIDLPAGAYNGQWGNPASGPVGAIEIKASWRILDPSAGDDTNHYYHQTALVTIAGKYTWSGHPLSFTAIVGLTGLHIIHKTASFPKDIWSTFEQIENVPDSGAVSSGTTYSFYNSAYTGTLYQKPLAVNGKLAMWNDSPPYAKAYAVDANGNLSPTGTFGSQVPRYYSIFSSTDSINKVWQAKLAGTPWAYYKLIGTQWFSSGPMPHVDPSIPNAPVHLANSTMESYDQSSASCITCHSFATIAGTPQDSSSSPRYSSDFSFLFGHAASATEFFRLPPKSKAAPAKK